MTTLKYLATFAFTSVLFISCQQEKKEAAAPAKTEKKIQPTTPSKPKKTGIPAVEAVRGMGNDLEKSNQQSMDLLNDATRKK